MSNRGKIWTADELVQLRTCVITGMDAEKIAELMGRTPSAIQARVGSLLHAEMSQTPREQVLSEWKLSSETATVYLHRYATVLRNQPAQKIAELTKIVHVLTLAILDPSVISAEQRAGLIAYAREQSRERAAADVPQVTAAAPRRGKKATNA